MASITTNMTNSFRQEILEAGHCFFGSLAQPGNVAATGLVNNLTSTANMSVGMSVSSTHVTGANVIVAIINTTAFTLSNAASGTAQETITVNGDAFLLALIVNNFSGTYDRTVTNYGTGSGSPTSSNLGTDEVPNGAGYTTGGFALTSVNPSVPDSNTAIATFSVNPSWTSATIDAQGCEIYNNSKRVGGIAGRAVSVHSFGGEQKVTAGTFTVNFPTANGTAAILRIG